MTPRHHIELLRTTYLRGPNMWSYRPLLEVWLDLGSLEALPSHQIPGLSDRLLALLPALQEHHCGVGERGGFVQRLQEGTWAGHILEHVVIELLNLADMPTGFGQTRSTSKPGVYRMVFRARDEQVARAALHAGHTLLLAAIHGDTYGADALHAAVQTIRRTIDTHYIGPSTASIVAAATERGIPHIRLNDGNLVQLGYGCQQRRIWTAETHLTSAIAEGIAQDKDLTKSLLASCGVPVPPGTLVHSAEHAWEAACELGLPVVVKPSDGNHGRGVSLELHTEADVKAAYVAAEPHGSEVLVERFIPGHEHRLLVVGGRLVAAARGELANVLGDGVSTVTALVNAQLNNDPRRGTHEDCPLGLVVPEEDAAILLDLRRQGLTPACVPAAGRLVLIQRNGNVSIDCTDDVHPDVAHWVTLAAKVVGLDIAGVDLVVQDISQPLRPQGGAVVEVNAGPGLLMHLQPAQGQPRPVGQAICTHLFPKPAAHSVPGLLPAAPAAQAQPSGRIPVVGVAGHIHSARIARLVAWLLHVAGTPTGLACGEGFFLGQRCIDSADHAHWEAGQGLLMNPRLQAAVIESSAHSILATGMAYDRCMVGVVCDLERSPTLSEFDIQSDEQMFKVLRTQVDVVLSSGCAVLNADDARITAMAPLSDGGVILYAATAGLAALQTHQAQGGRTVGVHNGQVVLHHGTQSYAVFAAPTLPHWQTRHGDSTPVLLAGLAAAWALGLSAECMRSGIETFEPLTTPLTLRAA